MPRERNDSVYLHDMLSAARAVVDFTRGRTLDEYACDLLLRSAVERQIEVVGEAARRVSPGFKATHPEIPWDKITRQRHVLAHDYGEIQDERIWRVATVHIPTLVSQLVPIVPPAPPDEGG